MRAAGTESGARRLCPRGAGKGIMKYEGTAREFIPAGEREGGLEPEHRKGLSRSRGEHGEEHSGNLCAPATSLWACRRLALRDTLRPSNGSLSNGFVPS